MGLKLKKLQNLVKNIVKEEKKYELLQLEVTKMFGPTIVVSHGLEKMAESVNHHLDYLDVVGLSYNNIKPTLLLQFINSNCIEVRKFVARLLPESFLKQMMNDRERSIRLAVARRLSYNDVNEMINRDPYESELKFIAKNKKRIRETNLSSNESLIAKFNMYGNRPIVEMITDVEHPGLTNTSYQTLALKIINMYGRDIEQRWEEIIANNYVNSMKSIGVDIDKEKLLNTIYALIDKRSDETIEEGVLSKLASRLRFEDANFTSAVFENVDAVKQLIDADCSSSKYIEKFEELFSVKYQILINPIKGAIIETSRKIKRPSSAKVPGLTIRNLDERAIDKYTNAWNTKAQTKVYTPYKLVWSPDPFTSGLIDFKLEAK